jgi:hypothetical protein
MPGLSGVSATDPQLWSINENEAGILLGRGQTLSN